MRARRDACEADVVRDGSAPRVRERARGSAALGGTAVHGRCMRDALRVRERVREGAGRCCGGGTAEACLWRAVGRVYGVGDSEGEALCNWPVCKLRNWPVCSYAIGPLQPCGGQTANKKRDLGAQGSVLVLLPLYIQSLYFLFYGKRAHIYSGGFILLQPGAKGQLSIAVAVFRLFLTSDVVSKRPATPCQFSVIQMHCLPPAVQPS